MFCEEVQCDVLEQKQLGGSTVSVIRMSYTRRSDSGHPTRIAQTAVVLRDPELELPQFALQPHFKGVAGMLLGRLAGMTDINFDDSQRFSDQYHLHAWNERAVRLLFDLPLRDRLADHPEWSARGNGALAVVFQRNRVCAAERLSSFTKEALEMLTLLQRSEQALDDRPDVRRESTVEDMLASVEKSGGVAALLLRKEIQKRQVSPRELEAFLAQPIPRANAPRGLRYQVGGDNGLLIVLGALFSVAGILVPIAVVAFCGQDDWIIAIPFGVVFALIGGLILFFSIRYRRQRKRLLRSGKLVTGKVTRIERTNVQVNNAQRYHLHLEYDSDGASRSAVVNLYANIDKAKKLALTREPVRILVDPQAPGKSLCIDTLLVFD